jgi:hypothetical protein
MTDAVSLFHAKLEQRLIAANARVAAMVAHHQGHYQDFLHQHRSQFKQKIDQEMSDAIQDVLATQAMTVLQSQLEEILNKGTSITQAVEKLLYDTTDYKDKSDTILSIPNIPTRWPSHHYQQMGNINNAEHIFITTSGLMTHKPSLKSIQNPTSSSHKNQCATDMAVLPCAP